MQGRTDDTIKSRFKILSKFKNSKEYIESNCELNKKRELKF